MPQRNDRSRSTPTTSPKNNSWFRMQAGHQSDADIYIYDEIGFWGVTAKQFISDLNALGDITHINLHINSPGGDVFEGIAIFNALKTHGASITVYVDGVAASMASVIAMVGNPVIMPENTFMMIHKPFGFTGGDAEDMRTYADLLDKVEAVLLPAYAQKTGKTTDEIAAMTSQLAEEERAQRQQHDLDIATVGMGDQQRQRYQVQLSLRQKYQQQLEQLRRDSEQKGTYNTDDYRKAEQALTESLNRQLNENRRYWQQLEIAQGNWKNGVLRALQNVTENADNTAGTVEQLFTSAFSSMSDWLATFCTTGKLNFKSFTSSVLSDMSRIMAQIALMKAVKGIASALPFDFVANADGGVYQSADLSRYSGTVVNRPTFFAFAKGAGVMGEAGPEAILPLRRGADGKLGVVADIGGSGMAMFAPQYNIEINNDGTNGQIGPAALKVVYDLGKKAAADFMQQQARDGGRLSGAYR